MSAIKEFRKLLEEAQKQQKESLGEATVGQPNPDMSIPAKAAEYLSKSRSKDNIPSSPENIEAQRWNDPLAKQAIGDFVTRKEMNESYGLFLQRIQQQMSTIGGGGEVNLRGLDDVITSSTGTNKFLTYNPSTRKFYFDFINPATESELGGVIPGAGFTVDVDGTLGLNAGPSFYLDESDVFRLNPGTADLIGGIKAGPGVAIDPDGTLFIDSEGVPFTFGDFTGLVGTYPSSNTDYAILGSINPDEDIVIASNGDGTVCVVGGFDVHATAGNVGASLEVEPVFRVLQDGQIRMLVPLADTAAGALEIIGNNAGTKFPPNQTGVILHVTGNTGLVNRNYFDSSDNYSILVGRRLNGAIEAPEGVLSGDVLLRIAAQGLLGDDGGGYTAGESLDFGSFGVGRIEWVATEDQLFGAQGGEMRVWATPNGSPGTSGVNVATFNATTGVTSSVGFVGDLTGNADTVTNGVYTTDTGTVTNTMLANSTISGVALGSNLAALSAGNYLTGTDYTGATTQTFAVDATTAATASKVVARDVNGAIAATGTILTTRDAGSFGAGQTITIDMATDHYVHATVTSETVTVAYTNITAGKQVFIFFTNSTGDDLAVDSGLSNANCTNSKGTENVKKAGTSRFGAVSFGTSTATMYGNWEK